MSGLTKTTNPATGEPLTPVPNTSDEQVRAAIANARVAQKQWAAMAYAQRALHVQKIKKFLAANADRAASIIAQSTGKTRQDALATEVLPCILACDWYAKNTAKTLRSQKLSVGNILFANKSNRLEYSPLGVVGIISPWNYPFSIPFGEVIMGLMAGNAIILKVATPTTTVGCFIEECIRAGGLPEHLFAHVVTAGATISKLMFECKIDKLFFTGSVGVGKGLMREAAATLTPLSLELGGKDAAVVLEDADLERAANCIAWAGYQNAGQSCGGVERVYVHSTIFDRFVALLAAKTSALRHGPDNGAIGAVDMGSLTTKSQYETVVKQVDEAVAKGARIVAQSRPVGDCSKGYFYPATLVTNVNHRMTLMTDETFGPVVPVMPFSFIDEAVALANDCTMALTASVFSKNHATARSVASRLEAGVVTINDHLYSHGMAEAPWGGWKESGLGRTHGILGLKEMSNVRCVNDDMLPSSLEPRNMWWYPFSADSYNGIRAGVAFVAPTSCWQFVRATKTLLGFAVKHMFTAWKPTGAGEDDTKRRKE
jgi:acyl-CoA reductase-like NAD-dependent aldehyde dehydrogenase